MRMRGAQKPICCLEECVHPMRVSSRQACLCNRDKRSALIPRIRKLKERDAVSASLRRHRCLGVIIFSKQPSDGKPSAPKVLDVEVQVQGALIGTPMGDFEFDCPKLEPMRMFVGHTLSSET